MKHKIIPILCVSLLLVVFSQTLHAGKGYLFTGSQGVMNFVQIDSGEARNMDVYRTAVADICRVKDICQVLFWTTNAPSKFPMTDTQVNSKVAHWQINMNTGLRRWFIDCEVLPAREGECL